MNTDVDNAFYVFNREDGTYMKYTRCITSNMYTYVVRFDEESKILLHLTVEGERNKFSYIHQTCTRAVCELQEVLASPSDFDLTNTIENNIIGSTPFTRRDAEIATAMHGRGVAGMKGEITKKLSKMPNPNEVRDILSYIVKNYSEVNLYIDVMYVNGIMFLVGRVFSHIGLI